MSVAGDAATKALPRLTEDDLKIYNYEKMVCGGYLLKRAGKSSVFRTGRFQKRWFFIPLDIDDEHNYTLQYAYTAEDEFVRQVFPLQRTNIVRMGNNSFQLTLHDGTEVVLKAADDDERDNWIMTIEKAITVANMRGHAISEDLDAYGPMGSYDTESAINEDVSVSGRDLKDDRERIIPRAATQPFFSERKKGKAFQVKLRKHPSLRLDIDIQSIPPASSHRRKFIEMFANDIITALRAEEGDDIINVIQLRPAMGMDWLTVVEFDIIMPPHRIADHTDHDIDIEKTLEIERELQAETQDKREQYLYTLKQMVHNESSPLYNGFVTCKLDSSFTKNFGNEEPEEEDKLVTYYSPEPNIVSIFNRYKDIDVPGDFIDMSHFTILLHYENRLVPLRVPNPLQLPRRRLCAIWPYEIKQALGLVDTMKELWITPICLIPRDMPMSLSEPIHFIQSARLGGTLIIPATRLKADLSYDVFCEDFRTHFGTQLEPEELEAVQANFRQYDVNGDGVISKQEMEELIRHRVTERKLIIDARFEDVKKDPDATPDAILAAEEGKQQYMQHLTESASKLIKMFEISDVDGDGTLSYEEFVLAEAWWMKCTLNPKHAHLF